MLQLWKLVLLCGLLTGSSASLLGDLADEVSSLLKNVKSDIQSDIDDTLQTVQDYLNAVQESEVWQRVQDTIRDAQSTLDRTASNLLQKLSINKVSILDAKFDLTADGEGVDLRVPVNAYVSLQLPLIGNLVDLNVTVDLQAGMELLTDPQTGLTTVVTGQCFNDPVDISVSLLNGRSKIIAGALNSVLDLLTTTVSSLLQEAVCPVIYVLTNSVTVTFLQRLITELGEATVSVNV